MFNKSIIPLVVLFLIIGTFILTSRNYLEGRGYDWQMLSGANLFIYIITVISMHLLSKGMTAHNTYAFLRNTYSGILIKLFACASAAFIYIFFTNKHINKPSLFASMGFYLLYYFVELYVLMKHSNRKKNVEN